MTEENISALEQALRDKAKRHRAEVEESNGFREVRARSQGMAVASLDAADLMHERDAELWAKVDEYEHLSKPGTGQGGTRLNFHDRMMYRQVAEELRAILEGHSMAPSPTPALPGESGIEEKTATPEPGEGSER